MTSARERISDEAREAAERIVTLFEEGKSAAGLDLIVARAYLRELAERREVERNAEIERLAELCEAYKGQVEAGAAEIDSLRARLERAERENEDLKEQMRGVSRQLSAMAGPRPASPDFLTKESSSECD